MSKGFRKKSRSLLKRDMVKRNSFIRRYLEEYSLGEKVVLFLDSGSADGVFHKRHYGKFGVVRELYTKNTMKIEVCDSKKIIYTNTLHIQKIK